MQSLFNRTQFAHARLAVVVAAAPPDWPAFPVFVDERDPFSEDMGEVMGGISQRACRAASEHQN